MRKQYKKGLAFLIACSLIGTDMLSFGSFGGMKKVAADEVQAQKVVESNENTDAAQTAGLNGVLVEDSKDSNIFYNASSEMQDFRDETIYFVMTTRFYDGDPSNNVECWDGKGFNNGECPWRGDFKGLKTVAWTSSDTSIARVNKNGTIQAVKIGKATITATTKGGVSATVEVEVKGATIYGNAIYFEKPASWGDKIKKTINYKVSE